MASVEAHHAATGGAVGASSPPVEVARAISLPCSICGTSGLVAPEAVARTCRRCGSYLAFRQCRSCGGAAQTDACGPLEVWTCPWCALRNRLTLSGRGPLTTAASYLDLAERLRPEALVAIPGDDVQTEVGAGLPGGATANVGPEGLAVGSWAQPSPTGPPFWAALRVCSRSSRIAVAIVAIGWTAAVLGAVSLAADIPFDMVSSSGSALAAVTLIPLAVLILGLVWSIVAYRSGTRSAAERTVRGAAVRWAATGAAASFSATVLIVNAHLLPM